ncbi:DUF2339 domain-containing protein [Peteryoungia desertarenae]|uniref:DUF2339 domain-containing protein n=1 Tax=Peteryoungia desertarenae TaxID=1813451 RepID=A0ABX6QNU5_9HYPH|nr:DUF2339 domain-containing protein [Peteryoungia desertarenae]QLF69952.1 DUF2339 domain-containing protein [Peteryoungia desertarenae]
MVTLILILTVILIFVVRGMGKRVDKLEREVATLSEELARQRVTGSLAEAKTAPAEEQAAIELPAESRAIVPDESPTKAAAVTGDVTETSLDQTPEIKGEPAAATEPAMAALSPASVASESLESKLGARWAVWAGGLALALGGLFLVRYSIESGMLGPGVRLSLAALFGLVLMGAGELIRRKALPKATALYDNAMVPGILTAAGTVSLFGAIFAAHGIYEFIGATPAFLLLALIAIGTIGLSLLHGQALAGLGLAGSMITPMLVSSTAPSPWTLFGFLTLSLVATALASRIRGWTIVPALAQAGLGLWALGYFGLADVDDATPAALALIAMIASWLMIWPATVSETATEGGDGVSLRALEGLTVKGSPGLDITMGLSVLLPALTLLTQGADGTSYSFFIVAALLAAVAAAGAARHGAFWPTCIAALGAMLAAVAHAGLYLDLGVDSLLSSSGVPAPIPATGEIDRFVLIGLAAVFMVLGLAFIQRRGEKDPAFAAVWSAVIAAVPVFLATVSFVVHGVYALDWLHAFTGLVFATLLLAGAETSFRRPGTDALATGRDLMVAGSFANLAFALHCLTDGLATTVGLALIGAGYLAARRLRPWSALPWMMVAALLGVMGRIAWDPTLVGADNLGKTPVFNALLVGYGLPALLAIGAAFEMRRWPSVRVLHALQGLASLLALLAVAILVRHAMNGGVLDSSEPTLGEQSIYTLLVMGLSGVLMTLDLRSPSPVFRYGSMVAGVLSMVQILFLHLLVLNPYLTGESTGPWPLVNLLLIAYLLPGLAYAALALYARERRPKLYVMALALSGAMLGFAWVTLSVRRFWQGEFISSWQGFLQAETYSYSVAWLAVGVGLLLLGSKLDARSLRIASAALVLISVAKAFLIDMSNLEGVLRALSFIGLGVVLIGIGLFYQKVLGKRADQP